MVKYERNELDEAYKMLTYNIKLCKKNSNTTYLLFSYVILSKILLVQRRTTELLDTLDSIKELLETKEPRADIDHVILDLTRLVMSFSEVEFNSKQKHLFLKNLANSCSSTSLGKKIVLAELKILEDDYCAALEFINDLIGHDYKMKDFRVQIKLQTLKAALYSRLGNIEESKKILRETIKLTYENEYIRTYVDFYKDLMCIFNDLGNGENTTDGIEKISVYTDRIARCIHAESTHESEDDLAYEENEILSPREYEVLKLVSDGLSNEEIASTLFISLSTVKKHISSVFEKLKVNKRTKAIMIAKKRKLI